MGNWNLSDWALLATLVSGVMAFFAFILSREFRDLISKLLQYRLVRITILVFLAFICGWTAGTLKPVQLPTLVSRFSKTWPPQDGILASVRARGHLQCGVNGGLKGFSEVEGHADANGFYENAKGFDADFCRAVATSIFDDYKGRVKFLPLDTKTRFSAVENGTVDVLFRNTSATVGRELARAVEFGPTIFYDEQAFMVLKNSSVHKLQDLYGQRICVVPHTTTINNLNVEFRKRNIDFTPITKSAHTDLRDNIELIGLLDQNQCDAITSDRSQLASIETSSQNRGNYRILEEGISKELLSPVTIKGDEQWNRVVRYSIFATIEAAEMGINQDNVSSYTFTTADPNTKVFLGLGGSNIQNSIGRKLYLQ